MLILIEKDSATRVPREVRDLAEAAALADQGFTVLVPQASGSTLLLGEALAAEAEAARVAEELERQAQEAEALRVQQETEAAAAAQASEQQQPEAEHSAEQPAAEGSTTDPQA